MAGRKKKPKRIGSGKRAGQSRIKTSTAIALILLMQFIATGIKAFDDFRSSEAAITTITHREAIAISAHINGKVELVRQTLAIGYQSGWGSTRTTNSLADLDAVSNLADALTAPPGSRLQVAGDKAALLVGMDEPYAISDAGDFVIPYEPASGPARFGLVKTETWLPPAAGARTFSLSAERIDGLQTRTSEQLTACSPIQSGAMSVCVTTAYQPFSQERWLNLLGYGLLLIGPAFALLGLLKLLQARSGAAEAYEGQATRAGRVLKTVLKEAKAGFWSWDFDQDRIWLSEEAAKLIGCSETGYVAVDQVLSHVHEDQRAQVEQALATLPDRNYMGLMFASPDKSAWLDMRARPHPESGEINGILLDVTEMRSAIARTKQAEQRLRSALEGFSGPFALWDKRKRLIYWNRAFATVFGLEDALRVGMSLDTVKLAQSASITESKPSLDDSNAEVVRTFGGAWHKMVERSTSNGGLITLGLDVSADVENEVQLTAQQSRLKRLVQDLERSEGHAGELATKLNEEKLRAEESANSKSAFLANMSHELRTPLNAINGFSEILATEMYGPIGNERYLEYAQDILASGQHLLDMINDILDMAKIEAGKMTIEPQPLDLIEPVDAAVRMIRRKAEDKGINLQLRAEENLPRVDADHRAIRQMILNLVSNSIKFTDDGGTIRVSITQKENMLRVAVRDTGVGIPSEALPRLAEPFEQVSDTRDRNYEGTGLGLALTKSFAEMHGGRLTIASKEGKGTLVCFYIPITEPVAERSVA